MRENTAKSAWKEGRVTHGAWLSVPSSVTAEVMAHQGFDWLCIDMQHGLIDYPAALTMLQAINSTQTPPFVRVPWNEPGIIGKMLDAGALGVIIPMVNSVEEARAAVSACRYFPDGARSFGPTRLGYAYGTDYFANAGLAEKHAAAGYRMITVSGDLGAMTQQAAADLKHARGSATDAAQPIYR
jgi:4-hydroxy-2-oxoheptanedioate aldolase